jgi:tRNA threonylcarbamoyladenosine biosynthesis protein TsaB
MRRLIIDTATRACSVALFEDDACIASAYEEIGRGHAERLVPMIAELPDRGRADIIHVNVGPGSFTGIRVGVSAARALAMAWKVECQGYANLELIAAMVVKLDTPMEAFDVVMIGGHGEYFVQSFDADGLSNDAKPISIPIDQALAQLKCQYIVGDAADQFVTARGWGKAITALPDAKYWHFLPKGAVLPPSPFYGRGADAKLPGGIIP